MFMSSKSQQLSESAKSRASRPSETPETLRPSRTSRTSREARSMENCKTGHKYIAEITQGSWEAEGNVVVIRPDNSSMFPSHTTLLYEANAINCGGANVLHGRSACDNFSKSDSFLNNSENTESLNTDYELEVNARAIASVPDMLRLLRKFLIFSSYCKCIPEEYEFDVVKLLMQIYDVDSVVVDHDTLTLRRKNCEA